MNPGLRFCFFIIETASDDHRVRPLFSPFPIFSIYFFTSVPPTQLCQYFAGVPFPSALMPAKTETIQGSDLENLTAKHPPLQPSMPI
jgi:hypothetical protein